MTPTERQYRIAGLRGVAAELDKIDLGQPAVEATSIWPRLVKAKRLLATQITALESMQRREPELVQAVEHEAKRPAAIAAHERLLIDPPSPYEVSQIPEEER